jgi:hypothetical protein
MFRIMQDPSSGSDKLYLTKITDNGSIVQVVVCMVSVWQHMPSNTDEVQFITSWWWILRDPKDVEVVFWIFLEYFKQLQVLIQTTIYIIECISWIIKWLISMMHGANLKTAYSKLMFQTHFGKEKLIQTCNKIGRLYWVRSIPRSHLPTPLVHFNLPVKQLILWQNWQLCYNMLLSTTPNISGKVYTYEEQIFSKYVCPLLVCVFHWLWC